MSSDAAEPKSVEVSTEISSVESSHGSAPPSVESEELTPEQMDRYECRACGYVYEPTRGDGRSIEAGIPFTDLPLTWRCPVCGAKANAFSNIGPVGNPSGFKENLRYGFGVNSLTPGQKNILIFGSLALGVLFFLSLYGLR